MKEDGDDHNDESGELSLSRMDDEAEVPKIGMRFGSDEEIRSYYMKYGSNVGFSIRRACTKIGDDGKLKYFSYSCSRSRKPTYSSKNSFRLRPSMRTDCKAKINVVVGNDGRLVISKVRLDHNHPLSPGTIQNVRCKKKPDEVARVKVDDEVIDRDAMVMKKETPHLVTGMTHLKLDAGDAQAIQDYFIHMQEKNENFFYVMGLNEDGGLRNVFWADSRSRATYEAFGDVIMFDSTSLGDKYDAQFAALYGVNHHGHCVLLGCGLLTSEDTETYVWFFRCWLRCMSRCSPEAIFTERSEAIQAAILSVFPDARRRICLWHVMKAMPEKLEGLAQCQVIKKVVTTIVHDSLTPNEFEDNWIKMIGEYNLGNNEWFKSLYEDRHHWAPVFVKEDFWAGISMMQCCRKTGIFFDGAAHSKSSLKSLLEQYDNLLSNKIQKESKADSTSCSANIPLFSDLYMEKQFQEIYTHEIFKLFQDELKGLLYCNTTLVKSDGCISTYEVIDSVKVKDDAPRKEIAFNVLYNEAECHVRCTCCSFQFRGILCRHVSAVFIKKNIVEIPPQYLLSRWRKDIIRRHTLVRSSCNDCDFNPRMRRYDQLCKCLHQIAEMGAESDDKFKVLAECMNDVKEKLLKDDWIYLTRPLETQLPLVKPKEPTMEQTMRKKRKKILKGKKVQPVNGDECHREIGVQGNQILKVDPPHSWNADIPIYHDQPKEMGGFVEFTNNWQNFNSGHLLQHGEFEPNGTNDNRYMTHGSIIDPQNSSHESESTQTTTVPVLQQCSNSNGNQNPLNDAN